MKEGVTFYVPKRLMFSSQKTEFFATHDNVKGIKSVIQPFAQGYIDWVNDYLHMRVTPGEYERRIQELDGTRAAQFRC